MTQPDSAKNYDRLLVTDFTYLPEVSHAPLARTAVRRVPYAQLRRISAQPWQDLERGRHRDLAAAELRRLGLRVPDWSEPDTDPALRPVQPGVRRD